MSRTHYSTLHYSTLHYSTLHYSFDTLLSANRSTERQHSNSNVPLGYHTTLVPSLPYLPEQSPIITHHSPSSDDPRFPQQPSSTPKIY
jgi:hypothetical protein